jgi:predicted nucleic acid-binding protein
VAWVVDTSVLLDIRQNDPEFGPASAKCLVRYLPEGLILCPVTYIELAPEFAGDSALQEEFFQWVGVQWSEPWTRRDTENAFHLWADHVAKKRSGHAGRRPVADVLIEAFAQRFQGLITRNTRHFTTVELVIPKVENE